jgi:hypothetical protein
VLKVPFAYLIFNICSLVGLVTLISLMPSALAASFGLMVGEFLGDFYGDDRICKRTAWLFGLLAAIGFGGYFLFLFSSDARTFTDAPMFDAIHCFSAALGGTVLVTTYVVLGKRLLGLLKDLKSPARRS